MYSSHPWKPDSALIQQEGFDLTLRIKHSIHHWFRFVVGECITKNQVECTFGDFLHDNS